MRLSDSRVRLYLPSAEVDSDGVAAGCACFVVFLLGWRHGRWVLYYSPFWPASLRVRLGLTAGWCDSPASLSAGHGDRRDRLYLPAVVAVRGGMEESAGRGAADISLVPDTAPAFPPPRPGDCHWARRRVSGRYGSAVHGGGSSSCRGGGGGGGVLLFVLPFCWIATSVHIPLGLGLGSGPCGGYLDAAETFLGLPHAASGWGWRPVGAIYPPYLYVGHGDRLDHMCLSTVVTVHGGVAAGGVRRGWRC